MRSNTPPRAVMICPDCGKTIRTSKSMLGGTLAAWHKPPRGSKARTFAKGQCIGSGTVYNDPKYEFRSDYA